MAVGRYMVSFPEQRRSAAQRRSALTTLVSCIMKESSAQLSEVCNVVHTKYKPVCREVDLGEHACA